MHSDEIALLAAVHAAPLDNAPRLVLADWLDERCDPLGEFLRLSCVVDGPDGPAKEDPRYSQWEAAMRRVHWESALPRGFSWNGAYFKGLQVVLCREDADLDAWQDLSPRLMLGLIFASPRRVRHHPILSRVFRIVLLVGDSEVQQAADATKALVGRIDPVRTPFLYVLHESADGRRRAYRVHGQGRGVGN